MQQKEMNHFINILLWIGFLLVLMVFVGCTTAQSDTPGSESTLTGPNDTPTASADVISSPVPTSISETPTATATPAPSIVPTQTPLPTMTIASISTATPTLTPLPTIPPSQRGQVYNDLMSGNGGCTLPCWWGFELGKASIGEVRQLYTSFDSYISEQKGRGGVSVLEVIFVDPQIENGIQVRHTFMARDDLITEAEIQTHYQSEYQITSILEQLGQPSEIWMWTISGPFEGSLPARFRLFFPEQGIFMGYATEGMKQDDVVDICFEGSGGTALLLWDPKIWDPESTKGIVDRANEGGSAFTLEGYPINEVSNWDVEEFYTILSDPAHSECLETPSELWSSP